MRLGQGSVSGTSKTWVKVSGKVEGARPKDSLQIPETKIVVYTALFGDVDRLWSVPPIVAPGVKYVVFTEKPRRELGLWTHSFSWDCPTVIPGTEEVSPPSRSWEQRIIKMPYEPRKSARYYKTMAHKVLRGVDISIWVDANVRLLLLPEVAVERWARGKNLATFSHPDRSCLFEEARACQRLGIGDERQIAFQIRAYRKARMPTQWGLAETRCVIRRHTKQVAELNELWWKEIRAHSERDQISFPYVCWKKGISWEVIPGNVKNHKEFWFTYHSGFLEERR